MSRSYDASIPTRLTCGVTNLSLSANSSFSRGVVRNRNGGLRVILGVSDLEIVGLTQFSRTFAVSGLRENVEDYLVQLCDVSIFKICTEAKSSLHIFDPERQTHHFPTTQSAVELLDSLRLVH